MSGNAGCGVVFMVLVGFPDYQLEGEVERITTLHEPGIQPRVMVYRDYGAKDTRDRVHIDLQRSNNGHAWRSVPWAEYRRGVRN